jgi:hypothetical protein
LPVNFFGYNIIVGLPEPEHPLSINSLIKRSAFEALNAKPVAYNFYSIGIGCF